MGELRDKNFPTDDWFFIPRLPLGTTAENLSAWFATRGLEIPADHLSIKEYPASMSCIVCVPKDTILSLLCWAIGEDKFMGAAGAPEKMKFAVRPQ